MVDEVPVLAGVFPSLTNSGMRQRCAQPVMPRSSALPALALDFEGFAELFLDQVPLYGCLLSAAMPASAVRWFPLRFSGFFRSARMPLPSGADWSPCPSARARSSAASRRRTSST